MKQASIPPPRDYWKCFHCGQVFVDEEGARNHFGPRDPNNALHRREINRTEAPAVIPQEAHKGNCNPFSAPCGAKFCTPEEMAEHSETCALAPAVAREEPSLVQALLDVVKGTLDTRTNIADHPNVKFAQMQILKRDAERAELSALRSALSGVIEHIEQAACVYQQAAKQAQKPQGQMTREKRKDEIWETCASYLLELLAQLKRLQGDTK